MKSYTDLEQSKKLAEILPIESADMYWSRCTITDFGDGVLKVSYAVEPCNISQFRNTKEDVPCWSLAALLNILNSIDGWYPGIDAQVDDENLWQICMFSYETGSDISTAALNKELVDTCYEVILKLKEKKIL